MVGVADGGVAPRSAADLVADDDELAQLAVEGAAAGVHRHQGAAVRAEVEAAQPRTVCPMDEVAGEGGVDRSESDDVGGGVVVGEQGAVGHHDLHLDVDLGGARLPGEALDQGVGHDLTTGAGVPVDACGVGGLPECGQTGDALLDGQEAREVAHRVGRGSQADVAVGPCPARTADRGSGVEAVADRPRLSCRVTVAEAGELRRRARRRPAGGARDRTAVSRTTRVARHSLISPRVSRARVCGISRTMRPGQAQVPRAAVGTGAPRQRDLAARPCPRFAEGNPRSASRAVRALARLSVTRAWAAAIAPFSFSRHDTYSICCASVAPAPSSAASRSTAHSRSASVDAPGSDRPGPTAGCGW